MVRRFHRGLTPAAQFAQSVDGGTDDLVQWTLTDHLNTVRDIAKYDLGTDMTTVVNHLVYDGFGSAPSRRRQPAVTMGRGVARVSPRAETRGSSDRTLASARPFDPDTGLKNNLNRWYDPSVGRWLSEDPIGCGGGDRNLYRYVRDEVTTKGDPHGLGPIWDAVMCGMY